MSLQRFFDTLRERFQVPFNAQNQLLGIQGGIYTALPAVVPVGFVTTDTELNAQLGETEDFATVFNKWLRVSRNANPSTDQDLPDELETWEFDETNNRIVCTKNTSGLVGFVSPESFDDYTFEVEFSSIGSDDDFIGVMLAYAIDGSTGNSHVLTVLRGLNGQAPMVIEKDRYAFGERGKLIQRVTGGLHWPVDGEETEPPLAEDGVDEENGGPGWASLTQPVKLRVVREGNVFTIDTSDINETSYLASAQTVIDLDSDPDLEVFKGPQRYGYACISQNDTTWETLQKPGVRNPIVDLRDYTVYEWEDNQWVSRSSSYSNLLSSGIVYEDQVHFNPTTGRFYYADSSGLLTL